MTVATVQTHKGVNKMAEPTTVTGPHNDTELVQESLVEEVSIDGMCGVY
ncbi:mycofactocin [Mycobacteroides abscessus subsp. abscessus]|nr:mycofactocin [Mycobacteroides abscessus subsp. abscessus]